MPDTISDFLWKNTLNCTTFIGSIGELLKPARKLGYKYIVWNSRVYEVTADKFNDTGAFESDLR
ncbi:MAG: hypothetical protein M0R17_02000 [Candidatus Omnitrophica bacterium]|jgi:hypothetical protein|nr:hypothetical protein [Candidatus Omnitrophota bacterium]